jgi:release factor glutamine methyltransferase
MTEVADAQEEVGDMSDSTPEWLLQAWKRLADAGIASPEREAAVLAAHALGARSTIEPGWLPSREDLAAFSGLVARRCAREPLERLTGRVRFRQLEFLVGPGVFLPQPETSSLVDWVVDAARQQLGPRRGQLLCVDLCCGAGTIALCLASEVRQAVVHAVEMDPDALAWAARNAAHLGLDVRLHCADAAEALAPLNGSVDIVTSNPPYVAAGEMARVRREARDHDPAIALAGGGDGLDVIRIVETSARRLLRPGGLVAVEHSDRQGRSALEVFRRSGCWSDLTGHQDADRLDRFVTATRL